MAAFWAALVLAAASLVIIPAPSKAQSNYDKQANSIDFAGDGLPPEATLDGKVTRLDDLSPVIFLNRTKGLLNCAAGSMLLELKFNEPFYGRAYANLDRSSACQIVGSGALSYKLELPLKGCGTIQDPQRVFTNNVAVRFHPGLEMDGDEIITIVCRYPPPVAPPPAVLPDYIKEDFSAASPLEPPLKGFHILLIICAILFLSLLLLGLGCSYVCLKRRRVAVVRRHPFSSGTASEITKLSGSSLGLFDGLKIPRAAVAAAAASSGSEANLVSAAEHSDTLPSDYPSESPSSAHSEVEDIDTRSLRRHSTSSGGSAQMAGYENHAYYASEIPPPQPSFDVALRVKRAAPTPPPAPSVAGSAASDLESNLGLAASRLTTILEAPSPTPMQTSQHHMTTFTYVPELHQPPPPPPPPQQLSSLKYTVTPPVYSRILRRAEQNIDVVDRPRSLVSLDTEQTDTRSMSEMCVDDSMMATIAPPPPPPPPIAPPGESLTALEPPVIPLRRPEITSHVVDDVIRRTITETRTFEDTERRRTQMTEIRAPPPPPPEWSVEIRQYPGSEIDGASITDTAWDTESEASSAIGPAPGRAYLSTLDLPPQPAVSNWEILARVVNPPPDATAESLLDLPPHAPEIHHSEALLTIEDREKWRQIITTESSLRTMLTQAIIREDFERIRHDARYETLFPQAKWDVIIRILAPPAEQPTRRYRRHQSRPGPNTVPVNPADGWDARSSRRSSLPTLYEDDSDAASSVTLSGSRPGGMRMGGPPSGVGSRLRRASTSTDGGGGDVRSMSELTVDWAARSNYGYDSDDDDAVSHATSAAHSAAASSHRLARSLSQPSLARSASEFTEHWAAPHSGWDDDVTPRSSPEPRMASMRYTSETTTVQETSTSFGTGWR